MEIEVSIVSLWPFMAALGGDSMTKKTERNHDQSHGENVAEVKEETHDSYGEQASSEGKIEKRPPNEEQKNESERQASAENDNAAGEKAETEEEKDASKNVEEDATASEENANDTNGQEKSDFIQKLEKERDRLKEQVRRLEEEQKQLKNRLLRIQADYDNYRRRTKEEAAAFEKYRSQKLAEQILPVVDNFERALDSKPESEEAKKLLEGMDMIYRQLKKALENENVSEIEALGKPFDPEYHQAVMQVEDEKTDSNVVVEVLQKGYKLDDRVLRPAMVKVNA